MKTISKLLALAAMSSMAFAAPVGASPDDETHPTVERDGSSDGRTQGQMRVTDIDEAQARRAGNSVVVEDGYRILIDGDTEEEIARVPVGGGRAGGRNDDVTTQGEAAGDCGSSFIEIWDDPTPEWGQFETGFTVNGEARDFDWYIRIEGEIDNKHEIDDWEDHGPLWPTPTWTSGVKGFQTIAVGAWHVGEVQSGSVAYLTDGRVCHSLLPADAARIW